MVYYEKEDNDSYILGNSIQSELNILTTNNKMALTEDFYLFKKCTPPGVIVECGFISNENERYLLLKEDYQLSLAQAIYSGIYDYYLNK